MPPTRLRPVELAGPRAFDPVAAAVAVGLIATVGVIACGLSALRASRVDPMVALRQE